MKTSKEIMHREWDYPSRQYRAIDKDGEDFYYEHKPFSVGHWWVPRRGDCIEPLFGTQGICKDWASVNWEKSLQSFKAYQKLTQNEDNNSN